MESFKTEGGGGERARHGVCDASSGTVYTKPGERRRPGNAAAAQLSCSLYRTTICGHLQAKKRSRHHRDSKSARTVSRNSSTTCVASKKSGRKSITSFGRCSCAFQSKCNVSIKSPRQRSHNGQGVTEMSLSRL